MRQIAELYNEGFNFFLWSNKLRVFLIIGVLKRQYQVKKISLISQKLQQYKEKNYNLGSAGELLSPKIILKYFFAPVENFLNFLSSFLYCSLFFM